MVTAQNWINSQGKATLTKILPRGGTAGANEVVNPVAAGKLTGSLKIENFTALEEVNLAENDITELEIINCPRLTKINFTGNKINKVDIAKIKMKASSADNNEVNELLLGGNGSVGGGNDNDIRKLDLSSFVKLQKLFVQRNTNLHEIIGLEHLGKLFNMNTEGAENIVRFVTKGKLDYWKGVVEIIKDLIPNADPSQPLPNDYKNPDGSFNPQKIKDAIMNGVNSQIPSLTTAKEKAEKERDAAKSNYNQLNQQLNEIKSELDLGNDANQQQIIDKIKELQGRPTHDVHNNVVSHRNSLQVENNRLKNENKENIKVLTEATRNWGIKFSSEQKQKNRECFYC